ncbi:hypothetical protein PENSTE_c011G02778 [Penicillium steckii]|uniref:Uncharacterized protein n=1 Tax=Penicillium steckii TaxID=303698 RepID=A0A1V6T6L5_9EURO|nr:hypothetical protein PENSTE_c011G02778 [Penicillium steckii]
MSAAVVGSFSWPSLSTAAPVPFTMIRVSWYNSLVLAIGAVAVGMQQSVFLVRVGCLSTSDTSLLEILSFVSPTGRRIPYWHQVILWQTAVGLLECSIYFWLGGYIVFVWDMTKITKQDQQRSDQVVAGFCYVGLLSVVSLYLASMLRLWYKIGQQGK